jgi:hypothetical protein
MKSALNIFYIALLLALFVSCKSKKAESAQISADQRIPVKTTTILTGGIDEIISLNGKSVFLKKNAVISSIPGYLKKVYVQYGDLVHKNTLLFEIQTKESKALENSGLYPELYSSKSGIVGIRSPSDGIVSDLNVNSTGIYVSEGSPLCTIVENTDMVVQVNVPFKYNRWLRINLECKIVLPDSTFLDGYVYKIMPLINETSQTQNVLVRVRSNRQVPENLNVIVQFVGLSHSKALLIPKGALLTNEKQQEFWVMKILHDSMAVKVSVQSGIENNRLVEVFSKDISANDTVIIEGAYGLPDSTFVKIVK